MDLCKCGKALNAKHPERHADGTLREGNKINVGRRGHPGRGGKVSVELLKMMKRGWNSRPTSAHYRAAAMELNGTLSPNDVDWINPIDLEHPTVGELVLFVREIFMCRGADAPFKNFADRVAPLPARDVNLRLSDVPVPEADSPEGQAMYSWFEKLRPREGEPKH